MIYFVLAADLNALKIGFADQPWARMSKLQSDCPCELSLLAFIEGNKACEAALHVRFSHLHRRGEWFDYSADLLAYVGTLDPAPARAKYQSKLAPICQAAGIGKSYASAIVAGKATPPVPLMLHLFKTIGWKHPNLSHLDDEALRELAAKVPYRRKGAARIAA